MEGMQKQEEQSSSRSAAMGQSPSSSRKEYIHKNTFKFCREQGSHPGGGWWLHAEHKIPGAPPYSPHHQPIIRKSTTPEALAPNFAFKYFSEDHWGVLVFLSTCHLFSLLGPAINLSLLKFWCFSLFWPHCALGTTNLFSVTKRPW